MDNLMDKSALERLQAELISRRDKLQSEVNTIGLFTPSEHKVLQRDLQVTCYFIDQVDAELEYVERQTGTYTNPFINNYNAKAFPSELPEVFKDAFPKSSIDADNKDSIRAAIERHSDNAIDKSKTTDALDNGINSIDVLDFETDQG